MQVENSQYVCTPAAQQPEPVGTGAGWEHGYRSNARRAWPPSADFHGWVPKRARAHAPPPLGRHHTTLGGILHLENADPCQVERLKQQSKPRVPKRRHESGPRKHRRRGGPRTRRPAGCAGWTAKPITPMRLWLTPIGYGGLGQVEDIGWAHARVAHSRPAPRAAAGASPATPQRPPLGRLTSSTKKLCFQRQHKQPCQNIK